MKHLLTDGHPNNVLGDAYPDEKFRLECHQSLNDETYEIHIRITRSFLEEVKNIPNGHEILHMGPYGIQLTHRGPLMGPDDIHLLHKEGLAAQLMRLAYIVADEEIRHKR